MRDRSDPTPTNELSVVGLVCGVLALGISMIPILGAFFAWIFAVPALIFGGIGLRTARRFGVRRQIAISALLIALGSLVMTGFWLWGFPAFIGMVADPAA